MLAPTATALAILGMKGFSRMTVFSRKIWDEGKYGMCPNTVTVYCLLFDLKMLPQTLRKILKLELLRHCW